MRAAWTRSGGSGVPIHATAIARVLTLSEQRPQQPGESREVGLHPAGDIGVGGATLATQLQRAHLLDELLLFTHPVILGEGRPLFDELDEPVECDLLEQRSFDQGVTMHRYAVRGARG